jgi:hypothetical protein
MEVYDLIHKIINDTLDSRGISTTEISRQLNESRNKIAYWRNKDCIDDNVLYRLFEYLYPDLGIREYLFITEKLKTWKLPELKHLYENINNLPGFDETIHMKGYQWDILCKDVLRKIINLEGMKRLKESRYEKTSTLY